MKHLVLGLLALFLVATGASRAAAHDVPAELSITGFFDASGDRPEVILRVPLILLGNIDLPNGAPAISTWTISMRASRAPSAR